MTTMRMTRVVLAIWAVWSVAGVFAGPPRDLDPVELTGKLVPELLGAQISSIVGFRYPEGWTQIPVQIDERKRDWICCEGRMTARTYLRVHPTACTWNFYDLSPEAHGMRYYDNLDPDGFLVDGGVVSNRRAEYDLHSCC